MNPWVVVTIVAVLSVIGYDVYEAGRASQAKEQAQTIKDLTEARDAATGNADHLALALSDANDKVRKFEADQKEDLEKKETLQALAKVEAGKGQERVKAAKAVTTNTDDVLRTYWEAYGQ